MNNCGDINNTDVRQRRRTMKRIFMVGVVFGLALGLGGAGTVPFASAASPEVMKKAEEEGSVVWYTTMPGAGRKALKKLFEEKYSVKLEMFQAGSLDIIGRYQTELSAAKVRVDAIHITDMVFYLDMLAKGNLMKYDSPEYSAYSGLPQGWISSGYIYPLRVMPIASLVNTKSVDWKSIRSYNDMLGDVATSTRAYLNYYGLRTKYGTEWYKKLRELDAQYYESSEKAMSSCIAGQWPILFEAWLYTGYEYGVLKKAPVKSIITQEGCVVVPAPNTIMKQAPHPNAAKVFQDFLYSREAQTLLGKVIGVNSGRTDVIPPAGIPKLSQIKIIDIDFKEAQEKRKAMIEEWRQISGR
jgi:iron(III) transport system substrate-binding protein